MKKAIVETEFASLTSSRLPGPDEPSDQLLFFPNDEAIASNPTRFDMKITMRNVSRKRPQKLLLMGGFFLSLFLTLLIFFLVTRTDSQTLIQEEILESRVASLSPSSSYRVNPTDYLALLSHQTSRPPDVLTVSGNAPYPTSSWYQNMLLLPDEAAKPTTLEHAYSIPYLLDAAGPIPGIRVNSVFLEGDEKNIYANYATAHSVTLGSAASSNMTSRYQIKSTTPLGVTVEWTSANNDNTMEAPLVRGMPYATMIYSTNVIPVIATEVAMTSIHVDQNDEVSLQCGSTAPSYPVQNEVKFYLAASDATWFIFPSEPMTVQCNSDRRLQFTPESQSTQLVMRLALSHDNSPSFNDRLRRHSNWYPGSQTHVSTQKLSDDTVEVHFDWDAQSMRPTNAYEEVTTAEDLLMMTLPHHQQYDSMQQSTTNGFCSQSLFGPACFHSGSHWSLEESIPHVNWRAPRSPTPETLEVLGEALQTDLKYQVFELFRKGGGDTYFSGKQLAKLGRICLVADEWLELCSESDIDCNTGPTVDQLNTAVQELKQSVEIWLNGTGLTPFVYDAAWGGMISCGCMFDGGTGCTNQFPDCPALEDPLLNFGNAYYNDQHFHYGYFIYAAAIVSHFDPDWGRKHFEQTLLFIKSVANEDPTDPYFTTFRHKDWFLGSSWASGMNQPPFVRGRNQESSSEAIAAYEAVALYGRTLIEAWREIDDEEKAEVAESIQTTGLAMLTTEIRSTQRYWHIHPGQSIRIYPSQYKQNVVGIVWQLMLVFSTWFGSNPEYIHGIQLLPLTPIAEIRDERTWLETIYPIYAQACANIVCSSSGWKVLQIATLASIGYPERAIQEALSLPSTAFTDASGGGHSLSNTLWYIATRPRVDSPVLLVDITDADDTLNYCSAPSTCTDAVLETLAGGLTCRSRIVWLVGQGQTILEACAQVAGVEFPVQCGACDPTVDIPLLAPDADQPTTAPMVPSASDDSADLAYCNAPATCTDAVLDTFAGGMTCGERIQWQMQQGMLLSEACHQVAVMQYPFECGLCNPLGAPTPITTPTNNTSCPQCSPQVCNGDMNACPVDQRAPYLCTLGPNVRGCNSSPWPIDQHCFECCDLRLCGAPSPIVQPSDPAPVPSTAPILPSQNNDSADLAYCNAPTTCTDAVLDTFAGGMTCGERIQLQMREGMLLSEACHQVAVMQYPIECGPCTPYRTTVPSDIPKDRGCCSRDFKHCVSSCGDSKTTCQSCGFVWLSDGGRRNCQSKNKRCNAWGLRCCPGLDCLGPRFFRRCRVPP